ncbi:MAG: hypothetical protein Q9213_001526 [Squamulea squamosa]
MSGLNWGVGDLLTVTKLAWDLYHKCYLVAREAPDDFRQLVNELASLQGALRTLRDDYNSDQSFLERLGDPRKDALDKCLGSCNATLQKLQTLVIKYRELGVGDGKQFWMKLKWVSKKGEIADLRSRIMVHTCNITLCMSSIGNSSLARIESSLLQALDRQDASSGTMKTSEEFAPVARSQTEPVTASRSKVTSLSSKELNEPEGLGLRGLRRVYTDATLVEPTADPISDLTPPMSEEDHSEYRSPDAAVSRLKAITHGSMRKASTFSGQQDTKTLPPSPLASEDCSEDASTTPPSKKKALAGRSKSNARESKGKMDMDQSDVVDVVADAMNELAKVRQKEQSVRPLRIVREDPVHQADSTLKERFQQFAEDELRIRRISAKDWLRVATWWLLKARSHVPELESNLSTKASLHICNDGIGQAYVDLLKSSWILHTIILDKNNLSSLMTDENRKLLYNLSDGINEGLGKYGSPDTSQRQVLMNQNINIWELLQPEEETYDEDDLHPGVDNQRWITVEQDDAGEEDETVLYRTFVNAAIGSKRYRIKSRGAPYMLILSTKDGESQPKVTLCNQSGSISLTRDFTPEDMNVRLNSGSPLSAGVDVKDGMPLNFGRMSVTVAFANDGEQQRFMDFPRTYFNSVKRREPRQLEKATETLLFDRSLDLFEQLRPATLKPLNPRQQWRSCNLRVLETTGKEGWRTTRRLVVSSSAGEKRPWCTEMFLPLSNVRIHRDGVARALVVKWSDCTHERSERTDGNYNPIYSYVYDETRPNIALSLLFRNSADTTDFENTVLKMSSEPIFSSSTGPDFRHVYNISDVDIAIKKYKAILLAHTHMEWKYSELFYMYRDTDFIYDRTANHLRFPHVYYTDYISSHVEKLYKPDPGTVPYFSHCDKKVGHVSVEFDDEATGFRFMSALTSAHDLIFSIRAHNVATKAPRRFGSIKSNKCQAQVQLWQKRDPKGGSNIRLAVKWEEKLEDQWLTLSIQRSTLQQSKVGNRASLPKGPYERGRKLDMKNLTATDSRTSKGEPCRREGPVSICFDAARDLEEFAARVERLGGSNIDKREENSN